MSRGQGRVYRPIIHGRQTPVWWLDYSIAGRRFRESSGTTSKAGALDLLRVRVGDRKTGRVTGRPEQVTFGQLRDLAERQYELDGRRSLVRLRAALNHLEDFLGVKRRAPDITGPLLDAYAADRLEAGASRATVNYELAALRRAFRLAVEKGILATVPVIKLPRVRNARSGFFEAGDLAALMVELPPGVRPVVQFLKLTGWRRGEALGLTWDQVDWEGKVIRLAAADTKGGDPRLFPFGLAPELAGVLQTQWETRQGPFVFQRGGQPLTLGLLRSGWKRGTRRAGLEGRLVHDLRRTAARDLRRAGVAEGVIMKLCGWRTRSMFDRYDIVSEQDLAEAVARRFGTGKQAASDEPAADRPSSVSSSATT